MAPADGFVVVVDTKQCFIMFRFLSDAASLTQFLGCVGYNKPSLAPDHIELGQSWLPTVVLGSDPSHPSLASRNSLPLLEEKKLTQPFIKSLWQVCLWFSIIF